MPDPSRRAVLALPLALASPGTAAAQTDGVTGRRELVFADVVVNGRPAAFLVDTGAPTTVLDAAFAQAANVRLGQDSTLRGSGGTGAVRGRIAEDVTVIAGDGPRLRLDPAVADLKVIARVMGRRLDGILGGDYFARLVLVLDYRTGGARFQLPEAVTPVAGATPLHILTTPYVRATAEHQGRRVAGAFQIDTGSNTAVEFWAPFARRAFPGVRGRVVASVGLTGHGSMRIAELDALELAGRRITGLEANFADTLRPDDAGPDYAGLIGGPVFSGRVLTLDYARARMWLE